MTTNDRKGTALITGASTGIGETYADRLARRGYDLILVARNRERLDVIAARVAGQTHRSVEVITADLANDADLARIERRLNTDADITMLVNNAGVGVTPPILTSDVDQMDAMIPVNIRALMRLSYAAAQSFSRRGSGAIINLSSVVAVAPEALNGVYSATKAFVLALSQGLHHELSAKGVRVQVVLPGATATGFWDRAGTPLEHLPPKVVMSTDDLVDAALAGFDHGEVVTLPALPDVADWDAFEMARRALGPNLSSNTPAERYGLAGRSTH